MKDWLSRTQIRQRPMLAVYAGLLVLIAVVVAVMVLTWLGSRSDDRLAVIGNLLSFGTLLLALVAGIVALAAYSAATGLPDLKTQITVEGNGFNNIVIPDSDGIAVGSPIVKILVDNSSSYAARTPAVIVTFHGAGIRLGMFAQSDGWQPTIQGHRENLVHAFQWDGGPNFAIHGHSQRHLPDLCLQGLIRLDREPGMSVRLLADGYNRPPIDLPITFSPGGKYPEDRSMRSRGSFL